MSIEMGSKVLLVDKRGKKYLITAKKGEFHTDLGIINLDELLEKDYGDRIKTHLGQEFRILRPNIRDYIEKMKRGPQIVHPKDAGIIIAYAGISPGDIVVEAGVGSGALTIYLANAVGKEGRVISYEIREDFAEIARKNIDGIGFSDRVEIKIKDIYEGIDEKDVDHIVLDLPQPERVLPHAIESLKPGGFFVAYTPCATQVHRFYQALQDYREYFSRPQTIDVFAIEHEVKKECFRPRTMNMLHTGYLTFLRKL